MAMGSWAVFVESVGNGLCAVPSAKRYRIITMTDNRGKEGVYGKTEQEINPIEKL